ncbi:S-layer homology domain-containing protein [[Clostridium] colinum]|uniref:S-layer homology domain-containing protein n=1 Tax=[Clostridium] colinum TaxID=36835 RepID=UPI0020246AAA|nr:S-layer homology domain-containing protein [[Clostridium] colinum]
MKSLRMILAIFGLTFFMLFSYVNVYADIFNDVDKNNIAYNSIQKMYQLEIMVGDLQGNFNPDSYISKFEITKILSKFIQSENIDTTKSKYNDIVLQYDKKYNRWDTSFNKYIIILLEKGVLKEEDLKDFVIIDKNKKEQIRALSREEIALFLTRVIDKEDSVNKMNFNKTFNDQNNIGQNKVKSCYYMDSLGIISTKDNNFLPKNAVTKAELSIILDKFLQYTNIEIKVNDLKTLNNNQNIQTRFVNIQNVFLQNNSIQVKIDNETKIYVLDKNVKIYIDDNISFLENITPNTNAEIVIEDNLVTKIDIKTNLKVENTPTNDTKIYGIIKNISNDCVGLSHKEIYDNRFYSKEKIEIIPLSKNCKITKNGVTINNIEENSLATVVLENKMATQIIIEDDNALFLGTIIEKDNNKITIKTTDNKIFEMGFLENAKIIRNDKIVLANQLKIGDLVTVNVNKDKISNIKAKGDISKKQGTIKAIKINDKFSTIDLEDSNNNINTYYVDNLSTDIYSIRILDSVDLYLDSSEVYAINILDRKQNKSFSGEIIEINSNYITILTQDLTGKATVKANIDKDTIFFDYESLRNISFNDLKKGNKVYVVLKDVINNIASNINIVSR